MHFFHLWLKQGLENIEFKMYIENIWVEVFTIFRQKNNKPAIKEHFPLGTM